MRVKPFLSIVARAFLSEQAQRAASARLLMNADEYCGGIERQHSASRIIES